MNTYRVLGILWLPFCCYRSFYTLRALLAIRQDTEGYWFNFCPLAFFLLIDLAGIVASLFVFREARWARFVLGLVAVFDALSMISLIAVSKTVTVWRGTVFGFDLVSFLLLLVPRQDPASAAAEAEDRAVMMHGNWFDRQAARYARWMFWFHLLIFQIPGLILAALFLLGCKTPQGQRVGKRLLKFSCLGLVFGVLNTFFIVGILSKL